MKTYGQYCGLARAAELLGERWTLLLVRDLMVGPKRFNELRHGIPGIPSNLLSARLRDLEEAGVAERVIAGRGVVYALTAYGLDLEPVIRGLGLWGARRMDEPREGEAPTDNSLAAALQAARTPAIVEPFTVEVAAGPATAGARVLEQGVEVAPGPLADAALRIDGTGLRRLLADGDTERAVETGAVGIDGPRVLLDRFVRAFHVPLDTVSWGEVP